MNKLGTVMKSKNISGYELSKKTGVSQSYISELTRNLKNPSVDIVKKLAIGLGVEIIELIDEEEAAALPRTG
ncbi:helix-turn-helix transcriptional regulator [Anaerospora hongkongensis]|uniref:helix-turn-helix domain-containing protein n=1 Tax=Anaerospora hongkongensis TaxID=244830 RepID=UPI002FDA9A5A